MVAPRARTGRPRRRAARLAAAPLVVLAVGACGGDDGAGRGDAAPPADAADAGAGSGEAGQAAGSGGRSGRPNEYGVDCSEDEIPRFAEVSAFEKCAMCHSRELEGDERRDAPDGVNFDDYGSAAHNGEPAALNVFHGVMPPPSSGVTISEAEKQQLYTWALCGTPE